MRKSDVSFAVIRRLPRYLRHLAMLEQQGIARISSKELAERMDVTASQIRQDFNCFGCFGQQGYGYNIKTLIDQLFNIMGVTRNYRAILIGVGNIGHALLNNFNFQKRGFDLIGAFDCAPGLIGTTVNGYPVLDVASVDRFVAERHPDIAILSVPASAVHELAEQLSHAGVRGFWNFTNHELNLSDRSLPVENVHFSDSLLTLCYRLGEKEM